MKRFLTRILILGLAVLPAQAKAQSPWSMSSDIISVTPAQTADSGALKPAIAPPPLSTSCPSATIPCCQPDCTHQRIEISAEYLYWSVHDSNVPFAQAFDGTDPFNSVPRGPVGMVAPKYDNGFRIGAGVAVSDCSWVVGTYTYLHDSSNASLSAPSGDVLHSYLAFPNTTNSAGDSLKANASFAIDLQTFDLEYKCNFIDNSHFTLTWLAGARYGHLDQKVLANYDITGTTTVESHVNFDGGGPRAGLEGEYRILGGFYGYGKSIASLLAGQFSGSYEERNLFTGLVGQTSIQEERVVPILELELGLGWQSSNGRIRVSAGYYVGSWYNTVSVPTFAQAIQNTNYTSNSNNLKDTMTFDGVVGRVEFRY